MLITTKFLGNLELYLMLSSLASEGRSALSGRVGRRIYPSVSRRPSEPLGPYGYSAFPGAFPIIGIYLELVIIQILNFLVVFGADQSGIKERGIFEEYPEQLLSGTLAVGFLRSTAELYTASVFGSFCCRCGLSTP